MIAKRRRMNAAVIAVCEAMIEPIATTTVTATARAAAESRNVYCPRVYVAETAAFVVTAETGVEIGVETAVSAAEAAAGTLATAVWPIIWRPRDARALIRTVATTAQRRAMQTVAIEIVMMTVRMTETVMLLMMAETQRPGQSWAPPWSGADRVADVGRL